MYMQSLCVCVSVSGEKMELILHISISQNELRPAYEDFLLKKQQKKAKKKKKDEVQWIKLLTVLL